MARGYGWRCDNCGLVELKDVNLVSYSQRPPERWYVMYRDLGVDRAEGVESDEEWHLCSIGCLGGWVRGRASSEWARREASPDG